MQKQLTYKENFISLDHVNKIRTYFDEINDSLAASSGPFDQPEHYLGWAGTWSRQLHFELPDNPIHLVIDKLKQEFGDFECDTRYCSIEYLSSPFLPHTDVHNVEFLKELRAKGNPKIYVFIIPLWWKLGHTPVTGFFNSPPNLDEPLYSDMSDIFPKYAPSKFDQSADFSVRQMFPWKSPGDLIAWESFQWHSSGALGNIEYTRTDWAKEFITIEATIKS
jgi:hypothetical protein